MAVSISGDGAVTGVASINTDVSSTELGYLDGVTSAIQPQIAGAGGLVLVGQSSFSGVTSNSLNNVFSSTYDNYKVIVSGAGSNSDPLSQALRFRLRVSGSDDTSSVQYDNIIYTSNTGGPSRAYSGPNNRMTLGWAGTYRLSCNADIVLPAVATQTLVSISSTAWGTPNNISGNLWSIHASATAFDGLTAYVESGTFSGTIRVYGYAQ